jgi:EAL domain-containing protein (putative c-di-GMP-specific phosphodiesterase class I)/CheY-like chemotaxis protein
VGELADRVRPKLALVLDDEVAVATVVCKILNTAGVEARMFANPLQFLTELKRSEPDLVLVDLALGESDAIDVIRKLEVIKFKGSVLLISGRDESMLTEITDIGRSRGLDMMEPLQKPFRLAELATRLDTFANLRPVAPPANASAEKQPLDIPKIDLEAALRDNLLEAWYQPKIELKSLIVCGAEALLRVRDPINGIIAPVDFLPPASDPLWKPLSIFVIHRAVADWELIAETLFSLKMAVNIPTSILNAPGFVDIVRKSIPPDPIFPGLTFEITEDEIIRDPRWIREVAMQLRLCGVSISIEDFGTAQASLSRIKDLPFSELKIDRSFVKNCSNDPQKRGICQTAVDLAHRFGASASAEGVETSEELQCLTNIGFDTAQGFLFAKPMPRKHFLEFLAFRRANPNWDIRSMGDDELK